VTGPPRKPDGVPAPGAARPPSADPSPPASDDPASDDLDYFDRLMPRAEYMRQTPPVWGVSAPPKTAPRETAPVGEGAEGGAPQWLVVMMIASAAASATIVAYYLLRAPAGEAPPRGAEPAEIGDAGSAAAPSAVQPASSASAAPPTPARRAPRPRPRTPPGNSTPAP
jgi:hypothetical protein